MIVIDNSVYGIDNFQTYSNMFYKDQTNSDSKEHIMGTFHYFHDGKYMHCYDIAQ